MIAITASFTGYVQTSQPMQAWMQKNMWLHWGSLIIGICLMIAIACFKKVARKVPMNYLFLTAFTICWTYMVAGFCSYFEPISVLSAAIMTLAMFIGLTTITVFMKDRHFGYLAGITAALGAVLLPMIIFSWFFPGKILYLAICALVVVLSSLYIIFDTKMIMTWLSYDEYVIGALFLYVDLV